MKILHVINSLQLAGAERLVTDIAIEQQAEGHNVTVVTLNPVHTALSAELEAAGVPLFSTGLHQYDPRNVLRLRKYLHRCDVVHVHLFPSQYWVALARNLTRTKAVFVTTEHSNFNARCRYRLTTWTDRQAYRRYDAATCISPAVVEFMRQRTKGRLPLRLVGNGIRVSRFAQAVPSLTRAALGIPKDAFLLMQVALFREEKNQDCILRALTHLPEDVHAAFVGDGLRLETCRQLAASLGVGGRVHFLGRQSDVPSLLRLADVVVMSSHWEGFGLAAVEGMASGRPVLASDVEGLSGVVGNDELLFISDDDLALAKKVLSLRADSAAYARAANYCLTRANQYDVSQTAKTLVKFYEDTIKGEVER